MSAPLSFRAEWARQVGRRRTKILLGVLLALPLVFMGAFALDRGGSGGRGSGTGTGFVSLATSSGANFTVFTVFVASELLLYIVAALLVGDPVPTEASWSSLRYLLTAPVQRGRLLRSKVLVGLSHVALALLILPAWTLLLGVFAYGTGSFVAPGGGTLTLGELLPRLGLALAYIFVTVLPIAAVAFWVGVRLDSPLGAVGAALVVYIISGILDIIEALGSWRNGLPGHYSRAYLDLLQSTIDWTAMRHGVLWSVLWALVFFALGWRRFARKDILS